mgnify:CR=1 FL=1
MKNFRLLCVCTFLLFLDVASPFNACRDDRTKLEVNVQVVDNNSIRFNSSEVYLSTQTTTIDQATVEKCVKGSLKTGTIYVEEEKNRYKIEVTSYNIESITLVKKDLTEIEITLPYEFNKEDVTDYLSGKRKFIQVFVEVTIEYSIIIPEPESTID